jgi:tetratricopeptide (TPR) repeat protein
MFRLFAAIVMPLLFMVFLEAVLRVAGFGYPPSAIVSCESKGEHYYSPNMKFGWRFFPPPIAREFDPFVFPAQKSENTYRIFILGGSAAQGTPDSAFSFGRFLNIMLRHRYPQTNFEVINTAMPGINSHVVLPIAEDCARHKSDLFVVYMGNNEVIGPYGPGTIFGSFSLHKALIRLNITVRATRLGQFISSTISNIGSSKKRPTTWRGLEMFLDSQIRRNDSRMETTYQHFQSNLQDICRLAQKNNTDVLLATVGSNLKDCPPFASLHRSDLTDIEKGKWNLIFERAVAEQDAGKYGQAIEAFSAAAQIDDNYAELHFRLGRCFQALEQWDKARSHYIRARDLDTLRLRVDSPINNIIRTVATEQSERGIYLVDVADIMQQQSPNDITGYELFYEHVHLNSHRYFPIGQNPTKFLTDQLLPNRNALTTWLTPNGTIMSISTPS